MQQFYNYIRGAGFNEPIIEESYTGNTFIVVKATTTKTENNQHGLPKIIKIEAEGISRRSYLDRPDHKRGVEIAKGRAIRALCLKIRGIKISGNHVFMG